MTTLRSKAAAAVTTLCLLVASGDAAHATPVTINFDGIFSGTSYIESGFTISSPINLRKSTFFGTPSPSLFLDRSVTLTATSGGSFNLKSFDHLCFLIDGIGCPANFGISAIKANGTPVAQSLISATADWQTASPAGYFGLSSITFSHLGGNRLGLDTIVVEKVAPIPLPASGGLLALALAGIAALRRRKRLAS